MTDEERLKQIVEAALLAAGRPLSLDQLQALFPEPEEPGKKQLREVLTELSGDYQGRGIEITEVGSGFRIQVRAEFSPWVSKLWSERPPKYSRALLETLALIAYRQPITRGEIEDVRGVSVSSNIIKTLTEREWVRVVGHRDVPGKPALYATTREFLDYFNLKSLNELPTLAEIRDLDSINRELELDDPDMQAERGETRSDEESSETPSATDRDEQSVPPPQAETEESMLEADSEVEPISKTDAHESE
jgi:segregation and condensation protein B